MVGPTLRPAIAQDFDFWRGVHRACFKSYVEQTWGVWVEADQLERLQREFLPMKGDIIWLGDRRVGFLWVNDQESYLFIESIAILPDYQCQGIGTQLARQLIGRAEQRRIPIRLSVLKVNPARRLYERLGFCLTGGDEFRHYMERLPQLG